MGKAAVKEMTLEDRLAASLKIANSNVSLMEEPITPPPDKEEEVIPQLADVITDRAERLLLIRMIQSQIPWAEQERAAKKARKPLIEGIKKILGRFGVGKCAWEGYIINYFSGKGRRTINEALLIKALAKEGLQPNQITRAITASVSGKPTYTLRISAVGQEEED